MSAQAEDENRGQAGTGGAVFVDPETLCEEIEAYIAEKPFQSLAMALLAGIIVGKIIL
ncbi:MAG TPA: hypothetical protein VHT03_08390 [Rhizomicrobium sp.]|jgi:ElaB/YqjD/DUF883 family membrane-anchored ribosome-binding protein|nr:hypothetical protein [Rhizomicrobium sp.]